MPDLSSYHRHIDAARNVGLTLTRAQGDAFVRLLEHWAEELATRVVAGLEARGEAHALGVARDLIRQLSRDMTLSTRHGIELTTSRVARLYAEGTAALLRSEGLSVGVLFPGLDVRAAQAVLARPTLAASFKSIRSRSIAAVDEIVPRAVLRGATGRELARELRVHILGADAFPEALLLDRRRIGLDAIRSLGYEPTSENLTIVRQQAGQVSARADLIARTEPMNAELEAHRQGAIESPVVESIHWRLSHRHPRPDQCDVLAKANLFGLGAGIYHPASVPARPHPRCLCLLLDVIADPARWFEPRRPAPPIQVDLQGVAEDFDLTPSQSKSLRRIFGNDPNAPVRPREVTTAA